MCRYGASSRSSRARAVLRTTMAPCPESDSPGDLLTMRVLSVEPGLMRVDLDGIKLRLEMPMKPNDSEEAQGANGEDHPNMGDALREEGRVSFGQIRTSRVNSNLNSIRAVQSEAFKNSMNCAYETGWDKNAIYCIYNRLLIWEAGILPLNYSRALWDGRPAGLATSSRYHSSSNRPRRGC
jgi:hypothetical protein